MVIHTPAMLDHATAIEDSEWEAMIADFQTHPKPKKWKYRLYGSNGQYHVAVHRSGRFWHHDAGLVWEIVPMRAALQMEQDEGILCKGTPPSDVAALYKRGFEVQLAESLTYNHRPKKHPIRVKTKAGDPVRG